MKYKTQWHRTLLLTGPQKWRILICSFPVTDFIHFVEHTVNSFVSFSLPLSLSRAHFQSVCLAQQNQFQCKFDDNTK